MGRHYRQSSSKYRSSGTKKFLDIEGIEKAQQHIREAEELSRKLGGTDKDVKQYFFNLPSSELNKVLRLYGRKYGRFKEDYARETFKEWKSGSKKMSGLVAERIFKLLPPIMPVSDKYKLVEKLWKRYAPTSNLYITVGVDADIDELLKTVKNHLNQAVTTHQIPAPLEARFTWLSEGDVNVQQELLNYFTGEERELITTGLNRKLPVLHDNFRRFTTQTQMITETITIGSHHVEIFFDKTASGVSFSQHKVFTRSPTSTSRSSEKGVLSRFFSFLGF